MVQQSLTGGAAGAKDDVDDAFGQASVIERLDEAQRAQRSIAGGFDDNGVARDERREHFPGWDGDGKVPRRDASDDANRVTRGNACFVGQFDGDAVAEETASFTTHVVGHVDAFLYVAARLFEYLAHLLRHSTRQFSFAAHDDNGAQCFVIEQQFFTAGAGESDVDGGEDAAFGEFAVEDQLHVAGALEFFVDHIIHAAAGINQRGGDDSQAAAFFDFTS